MSISATLLFLLPLSQVYLKKSLKSWVLHGLKVRLITLRVNAKLKKAMARGRRKCALTWSVEKVSVYIFDICCVLPHHPTHLIAGSSLRYCT